MMMDYSIHKVSLFYCTKHFFKIRIFLIQIIFICEVWKCPKHSYRCCAITEILWSRSRLPEISSFFNTGDGYVIAVTKSYAASFEFLKLINRTVLSQLALHVYCFTFCLRRRRHCRLSAAKFSRLCSALMVLKQEGSIISGHSYACT